MDFGKTARDYGRHRAGFPPEFFERIAEHGIGLPGQKILDLGTGTGTLARGFALRGCGAIGLDPSEELMMEAKRLDREAGVSVEYVVGKAEGTDFRTAPSMPFPPGNAGIGSTGARRLGRFGAF
ncbi:hypothetical protein BH20ACT10_BH20ACT10_16840 [soil metagenome]|jgi:2-polyprenyl-3-methyl-5-hydroxy-6-metoxy-1,4-benzoquinol methylase